MMNTATATAPHDGSVTAQLGNPGAAALENLLSSYQRWIFSIAKAIVKDHHDAQEITQDTLFAVYRKIDTFRGDSSLCAWIYSIARNNAYMKLRRRRKEPHLHLDEPLDQDGTESFLSTIIPDKGKFADEWLVDQEFMEKIFQALDELPDAYRQILRLAILHDCSYAELGQRLHLSLPALKSRLHRARLTLRRKTRSLVGSLN